jgi:DNA (cytosine-5)-methyltransferase 1
MRKSHMHKTLAPLPTRTAVSLFTGAGGMDVGFEAAGFNVLWANDINEPACRTYERNHKGQIACGPIEQFLGELKRFEGVDLVFGGPPCQGFSVAGKMDATDARSQLVWRFFDVIKTIRPAAFVMENVKALAALEKWKPVREEMFRRTSQLGYDCGLVVLNSRLFGVPQSRERMFLIACRTKRNVRAGVNLTSRHTSQPRKVREILQELGPAGTPGNTRVCRAKVTMAARPVLRRSPYAGMLFNGQGRPINPDGVSATLHASMGGNKTPIVDEEHVYRNQPAWIESYHAHLMKGGDPLPFEGAPPFLRRLTVDEAIRIQTFPADYDFVGSQGQVFTQIGNAVPCRLANGVGLVVQDILSNEYADMLESLVLRHRPQMELGFA